MPTDDLFPEVPAGVAQPLTLYADQKHRNYLRERRGQECKCTVRSAVRKGKIVATIYSGEADAQYIIRAVNYCTAHHIDLASGKVPQAENER